MTYVQMFTSDILMHRTQWMIKLMQPTLNSWDKHGLIMMKSCTNVSIH